MFIRALNTIINDKEHEAVEFIRTYDGKGYFADKGVIYVDGEKYCDTDGRGFGEGCQYQQHANWVLNFVRKFYGGLGVESQDVIDFIKLRKKYNDASTNLNKRISDDLNKLNNMIAGEKS